MSSGAAIAYARAMHEAAVDELLDPDPITYTAACPGCGRDATWTGTPFGAGRGVELDIDCDCEEQL